MVVFFAPRGENEMSHFSAFSTPFSFIFKLRNAFSFYLLGRICSPYVGNPDSPIVF